MARKYFCRVLRPVLPLSFKKQASVKIHEASVKVPVKLNWYCPFPCIREAPWRFREASREGKNAFRARGVKRSTRLGAETRQIHSGSIYPFPVKLPWRFREAFTPTTRQLWARGPNLNYSTSQLPLRGAVDQLRLKWMPWGCCAVSPSSCYLKWWRDLLGMPTIVDQCPLFAQG